MPRPHVEFLRSETSAWRSFPSGARRAGCRQRLLSEDPDSGACSLVVQYPPGWTSADAGSLGCDEELFVLEGDLSADGVSLRAGDYAYWPAGYSREAMESTTGCTALTFFEAAPLASDAAQYDDAELIARLSTDAMPWAAPSEPSFDGGRVARKVLKPTAKDGGRTWLLRIEAEEQAPFEINGVERHPCVEEMFLLAGDIAMSCGTMRPGDYFWRPPNVPHGPMGTRHGFLGFFRAKEGSFATTWSEAEAPIAWDAPYRPILPQSRTPR